MRIKRLALSGLCAALAVTAFAPQAYAAPSDEIKKEIEGYEDSLGAAQAEEERLEAEIEETQEKLAEVRTQARDSALLLEEYKEGMQERLVYFYENSQDAGALEAILGGGSISDVMSRIDFQQELYEYDKEQLEGFKDCEERLKEQEAELTAYEEQLDSLLEQQQALESELTAALEEKQAEYDQAVEDERIHAVGSGLTGYEGWSKEDAQMDVATKVYSVLKAVGWSKEQIAGALGNINTENSFDFSCVETIYTEPFVWGPKKRAADAADYLMSSVYPGYMFSKVYRCGIGLIAWTDTTNGAAGNSGLRAYAAAHNVNWYNLDIQLEYLLDPDGGYSASKKILNWTEYNKYGTGTVHDATYWWSCYIEGCYYDMDKRLSLADTWYGRLDSMTYDEAYADKILSAISLR